MSGLEPFRSGAWEAMSSTQQSALAAITHRLTGWPVDPPRPETSRVSIDRLIQAIMARPWRRSAADDQTLTDIRTKVTGAVRDQLPIEFSLPFGGYKHWRLPGAPHPDWAEVFWIDYLRRYGAHIAAQYPHGVLFTLTYLDGVLGWVNNLEHTAQRRYVDGLNRLLHLMSSERIRFRCVDLCALHGGTQAVLKTLETQASVQPEPSTAQWASARRNLITPGNPSWLQDCDDTLLNAAVTTAARRCAAMEALEFRRNFNKFGPRIQLTHIRGPSLALHIGSCRTAVMQPWVAQGYLQWDGDRNQWVEHLGPHTLVLTSATAPDHRLAQVSPALQTFPLSGHMGKQ